MKLRRLRQPIESLLVILAARLLPLLPRRATVRLAAALGFLAYVFSRGLRRVALSNLASALGDRTSEAQRRTIAKGSFRTSALVILDLFWFGADPRRRIPRHVHFDASADPYFGLAPLIGVSGHIGNWEILGQVLALRESSLLSVAAPIANPMADRMLTRLRRLTGQRVAPREGATKALLRCLREGGRVGLIMDQNTVPAEGGEFVDFFGLPVPMSRAADALAAKTGAPVMFLWCLPDAEGNYTVFGQAPIAPGRGVSQTLAGTMEQVIRARPEAWMWTYKRWKYVPAGESPDGFPFYARSLREHER
jgi:lauroyl/myristoyl acyltransferase